MLNQQGHIVIDQNELASGTIEFRIKIGMTPHGFDAGFEFGMVEFFQFGKIDIDFQFLFYRKRVGREDHQTINSDIAQISQHVTIFFVGNFKIKKQMSAFKNSSIFAVTDFFYHGLLLAVEGMG